MRALWNLHQVPTDMGAAMRLTTTSLARRRRVARCRDAAVTAAVGAATAELTSALQPIWLAVVSAAAISALGAALERLHPLAETQETETGDQEVC